MASGRLERSCELAPRGWLASEAPAFGVARLRARLYREAFSRHRHDTYTVALTEEGVQEFDYRGAVHRSLPGQVVLLHPDEPHDGRAGTPAGFAYRTLYLDPARVSDAVRALDPGRRDLPFVEDPVVTSPVLAGALAGAFDGAMEPLRADALVELLARGLLELAATRGPAAATRRLDRGPLERAREVLATSFRRVVRSEELERVCGLSRFELCVQFRRRYGTSPYRFLLMRRLDFVRERLRQGAALGELSAEAGFSDQAHLTRTFKSAFGLTPHRFAAMHPPGGPGRSASTGRPAGRPSWPA